MAPLTRFVQRLRDERGGGESVPWFDPTEAGTSAPMLILLEAPGPRAVGRDGGPTRPGSGFVSPDNDDQSAQNMWGILKDAGVNRSSEVVTWNIVPWYVGDGTRIRPVTRADRREARPALSEFLALLDDPRVVILLGRAAAAGWHEIELPDLPAVEAPHPSLRVINTRPSARDDIIRAIRGPRVLAGLDSSSAFGVEGD